MSVGEVWWDFSGSDLFGTSQFLDKWVKTTENSSFVFDFSTKIALTEVFRNGGTNYGLLKTLAGKPMGLIGLNPAKSVTFIENHDTWREEIQEYNFFATRDVSKHAQSYAYILTHPGVPCIFWDHLFKWKDGINDQIKKLIKIRRESGLHSTSTVNIVKAETGLYAAIIDNKVAMKMGPNDWAPTGTGWTLATSGNQYAVWVKSALKFDTDQPSSALDQTIKLLSNPIENNIVKLQIESSGNDVTDIKIIDIKGSEILTMNNVTIKAGANKIDVPLNSIASGNYIAILKLNGKQLTTKFIVN
jgi:hypothetical protein